MSLRPSHCPWRRYIERPLLLHGRKFHLRAYALCVGSLQAYVFSEVLALFAAKPYDRDLSNLYDLDAHLTNTCRLTAGGGMHTSSGVCW